MFEAHFQDFEDPDAGTLMPARLAAFREELIRRNLTGFLVPRADSQQNEYVPPSEERLAWLTGFTGSAGLALPQLDRAIMFVDGRYTLQAAQQVDASAWKVESLTDPPPESWLAANLKAGDRIGYDPWLHTTATIERLEAACAKAGAALLPVENNPVDAVWHERPSPPLGQVSVHNSRLAGEAEAAKLEKIRSELGKLKADALVVSDPPCGGLGLQHPRRRCRRTRPCRWLTLSCRRKAAPPCSSTGENCRTACAIISNAPPPWCLRERLTGDIAAIASTGASIALDAATAADALTRLITAAGGKPLRGADPLALLKAVKNPTEIAGTRTAHARDAVALARFLFWVDREAPSGNITEIDAVEALETFRRETGALKDVSFPTISGSGPNGAIVHYRVTAQDQPPRQSGRAALDQFRRAVPGRHHRRDADHCSGNADGGDARPLHPCAARSHRDCARGISRWHDGRADRFLRAAIFCGRPVSISSTVPATASAATSRCTRVRRGSQNSAPRR